MFTDVRFNSDMLKCSTISSRWTSFARNGLYKKLTFEDDAQAVAWIESECTQRMEYSSKSLWLGTGISPGIATEVIELLRLDEEMGGIKKLEIEMEETFDSRSFRSEKLRGE